MFRNFTAIFVGRFIYMIRVNTRFFIKVLCFILLSVNVLRGQDMEEVERASGEVDAILDLMDRADNDGEREKLALQGLSMSRDLRYNEGIARAALSLGELSMGLAETEKALQYFLEAEAKLRNGDNQVAKAKVNAALGQLFLKEKIYKSAIAYYKEALKANPKSYISKEGLADAFLADLQFDSAETHYRQLMTLYREVGDNSKLVLAYQKLALAYDQQGNAGKSLYYYLPIEDLIERFGNLQERALLYNNLGRQYAALYDYPKALSYFQKAELQCSYVPCDYQDVMYANMGIALHNLGDSKKGLEYLFLAKNVLIGNNQKESVAHLEHIIATIYLKNNDLYNALNHNNAAMLLAKNTKQPSILINTYSTAADIYQGLYEFENAISYYRKYLSLSDSMQFLEQNRRQRLDQQRALLSAAEGQIKFLIAQQNVRELDLRQALFYNQSLELQNKNLALETKTREGEVLLLQKQKEVDKAKLDQQISEALRARQELRLAAQTLDAEKQQHLISELRQQEKIDSAEYLAGTRELELLRKGKDIAALQLEKQATFEKFAYGLGFLALLILLMLSIGWWLARKGGQRLRRQNLKIQAQNKEIQEERQKSEGLLLNILPEEVAAELKAAGTATPRNYESATVLFTDFVNFTSLSATMSPEHLVDELNACFLAFDDICERHNLEKIKTIGDAYMCAGGLPVPNETHPKDAVRAAQEMCRWLDERRAQNPKAVFLNMRIGIHTGPVVAGVVGKNKFAYDIWGDAVNLAARLEEYGEANRINISGATATAIGDAFTISYRGPQQVHNKGEVDMYFVES
jgi:adenylate cyclase